MFARSKVLKCHPGAEVVARKQSAAEGPRHPVDNIFMQLYNSARKKDVHHDPSDPKTCERNRNLLRTLGKALEIMEDSVEARPSGVL